MKEDIYNPDFIKKLFNKMSATYERVNYITSFGFSIRWRNQFLKSFNATNEKVEIIDFLTGMGETWVAIKRKFPQSRLSALDFSDGMLRGAAFKNEVKFNGKIVVLKQDILHNQLPSNHFDFVTCAFGLKTFDASQLGILAYETKRILKDGGEFSFIEVSDSEKGILKKIYGFYLGKLVPVLGRLFLGNPVEYKMLWTYTRKFKNARIATEIFRRAGLQTKYQSYFFGCATGFCGKKY